MTALVCRFDDDVGASGRGAEGIEVESEADDWGSTLSLLEGTGSDEVFSIVCDKDIDDGDEDWSGGIVDGVVETEVTLYTAKVR